jgi:hypothetical protein
MVLSFLAAILAFNPYNTIISHSCGIHKLTFDVTSVPMHLFIDKYLGNQIYQLNNGPKINLFKTPEGLPVTL